MTRKSKVQIDKVKEALDALGSTADSDVLAHAVRTAMTMGQTSEQAALEALRIQNLRKSGRKVIIDDDGYHAG